MSQTNDYGAGLSPVIGACNNSLDRSAGSSFFNLFVGIEVVTNRRAQSALTLDVFPCRRKPLIIRGVKVREIIRLLEEDGWYLARTRGSHRQFRHPGKSGTVTVSGKLSIDVPRGTLNSILKQAGLKQGR